jgi:hypothetical protein
MKTRLSDQMSISSILIFQASCHAKRTFLALTAGERSSRAVVLSARHREEILILSF